MKDLFRLALCSSLLCLTLSSAALANTSELADGIKKIQEGKYAEALTILQAGHFDSSQAAEAHYYKGCALSHLYRDAEAEREYKLAKLMDTSGRISPLATAALTKPSSSSVINTVTLLSDPAASVKRCAQRIMSQSSDRIRRVYSDEYIPPIRSRLTIDPHQSYSAISPAYNPFSPMPSPDRPIPRRCGTGPHTVPPPDFDPNRYQFYSSGHRFSYNDPQAEHLRKRANNVAESAEGLITLLTREDNGKGVFLVPEGTNLYVRNYEYGTPIDPPPPIGVKTDVPMLKLPKPQTQKSLSHLKI